MLAQAIEAEVDEWIEERTHLHDEQGRRQVVRNGYLPERTITTGVGEVEVDSLASTIGAGGRRRSSPRRFCRRTCEKPRTSRS